jgi:membrane protease YdiL (CAAX protease family)
MLHSLKRFPVLAGFVLMFALTWPIDLWAAADSHDLTSVRIPSVLPLFVGYGFVVAAIVMTGIIDGREGIRSLLQQFLIWRVGLVWYAVVLLLPAVIDLASLAVHVMLGGAAPDFGQPFARQIFGPAGSLWALLPIFFLMGVLTNGEEIGWRGYAQSRLQARHSALVGCLVVGLVAACWHIPKFLTEGSAQDYSFGLFVLDSIAKAILTAWVYNSTGNSLLIATLFHASLNTSAVFLPVLPAASGDVRPTLIGIGLHCAAAVAVVVIAGPARLARSRTPARPVEREPTTQQHSELQPPHP